MSKNISLVFLLFIFACSNSPVNQRDPDTLTVAAKPVPAGTSGMPTDAPQPDTLGPQDPALNAIVNTGSVNPKDVLGFARTLIGTPYVVASSDPRAGFDCSGFITYIFSHFNISVPRSSVEFTHVGKTISPELAKPGDLILFTGTDSTSIVVGHMGMVAENGPGGLSFIHSTSGKAMGVTISALSPQYRKRFVRVCRIFPANDLK